MTELVMLFGFVALLVAAARLCLYAECRPPIRSDDEADGGVPQRRR